MPRRFDRGIQVEVVAEAGELVAQAADVHTGRQAHGHAEGKHRGAGVCRRVGPGAQLLDIDLAGREEVRDLMHDARVVHGHHVHRVRRHVLHRGARFGVPGKDGELEFFLQHRYLPFQACNRPPVSGHHQNQGEFSPQYRHAAVLDIATAVEDGLGQLIDDAGAVLAQRGEDKIFFHGKAIRNDTRSRRPEVYRQR